MACSRIVTVMSGHFPVVVAAAGRTMSLSVCLLAYTAMSTAYLAGLIGLAWRYGSPRSWPRPAIWSVAGAAALISAIWWWIDEPVEGRVLLDLTRSHAITMGDMLVVPMLVAAALVVAAARVPALAREADDVLR